MRGMPVWSKNSSSLPASKILKFFNADEFREGARDPLQCDRFVIEDFAIDRIHRIYGLNRIGKTLAFSDSIESDARKNRLSAWLCGACPYGQKTHPAFRHLKF